VIIVGEPTALLATVIWPERVAAAVGLYVAVKVALVPGAKLAGVEIPEITTLAAEDVMLEIATWAVPMFVSRIDCVVVLPTTTFPKVAVEGVAPIVEEVAIALRPMATEGSLALLVMETVPVSVPAATGLYVTVKLVACPAASVMGAVKPETLTPAPENDSLEIAALALPVFVTFTV